MMSNTESNQSHCLRCFVYGDRPSVWLTNDILLVVDYYYLCTYVRPGGHLLLLRGNRSNLTHKSHTRNTLYVCTARPPISMNHRSCSLEMLDRSHACVRSGETSNLGQNEFSLLIQQPNVRLVAKVYSLLPVVKPS